MMRKNKAVKILRNTKKTALLIYAAAFILLIVAGVRVSGITKEAVRGNDRHKPYEFYELYNDFSNHDYARLQEKVHTNIALGANPGSDEKQLYDFALSYEAAVNYYMYTKNGMNDKAQACRTEFSEHEGAITRKLLLDALEDVKSTYGIS